jgi:hypothetical protein
MTVDGLGHLRIKALHAIFADTPVPDGSQYPLKPRPAYLVRVAARKVDVEPEAVTLVPLKQQREPACDPWSSPATPIPDLDDGIALAAFPPEPFFPHLIQLYSSWLPKRPFSSAFALSMCFRSFSFGSRVSSLTPTIQVESPNLRTDLGLRLVMGRPVRTTSILHSVAMALSSSLLRGVDNCAMNDATPETIAGASDITDASIRLDPDMLAEPTIACLPSKTTLECSPSRLWIVTPPSYNFLSSLASVWPDRIALGDASQTSTSPDLSPI